MDPEGFHGYINLRRLIAAVTGVVGIWFRAYWASLIGLNGFSPIP